MILDSLLYACTTCRVNFGDSANAASWSIFALLMIILPVAGGVGFFLFRIARREREFLDPELMDEVPVSTNE